MKLEGKITKIFGINESKKPWASILIETEEGVIKAAGHIKNPSVGALIKAEGDFKESPTYGRQFSIKKSEITIDDTLSGITAYLCSSHFKGIGINIALDIVNTFSKDVITIIENNPEKLVEIKGVTEKKAYNVHEMHKEYKHELPLYNLFKGRVTENQIKTILNYYGDKAESIIRDNPYTLIRDIKGFAFKRVDALAQNMGLALDDDRRVAAAINFILTEWMEKGHCYGELNPLIKEVEILTGELSDEKKARVLGQEIDAGFLVYEEGNRVYLSTLYHAESYVAKEIGLLLQSNPLKNIEERDIDKVILSVEETSGFSLEDGQIEAVKMALRNRVSVITGGPGTGKTTIINAILKAWNDETHVKLLAPTGKASRRISELTGGSPSSTIHKLILNGYKETGSDFLIILDEASMLDINLAKELFKYIEKTNSQIVLIGDIDQLPPIGPGNFLRDLVDSPLVPTARLRLSHRQHGNIAINADRVKNGDNVKRFSLDDSFKYVLTDKEEALSKIIKAYECLLQEYELKDISLIVPMRRGNLSDNALKTSKRIVTDVLNNELREIINPECYENKTFKGCPFRVGDRVLQTVNDYSRQIFNGDVGTVINANQDELSIKILLDDGREVIANKDEIESLTLAFAITAHKVQGSEYKAVIVANLKEHYILLDRNMLYTEITRAREKVILITDSNWTINYAISQVNAFQRNTKLKERIIKAFSKEKAF